MTKKPFILLRKSAPLYLISAVLPLSLVSQELIYQEGFNTDGESANPQRYVTEDRNVIESGIVDQEGPVYWEHNFNVSIVGVGIDAPARRVILTWNHNVDPTSVTSDAQDVLDATIDWLLNGKQSARVLFSPPPAGEGDQVIVDRLVAKGHSIMDDAGDLPASSEVDLVVHSSSGSVGPSRFTLYPVPMLTYNAADHDDELTSSIGQTASNFDPGDLSVTVEGHPIGAGKTGNFQWVTSSQPFDTIGSNLPQNSQVVISQTFSVTPPVESLAQADELISGTRPSIQTTATVDAADLFGAAGGVWGINHTLPNDPRGGFAVKGTGRINVSAPGTYGFAIGADDGARLRIDRDRNGLSAADDVVALDGTGGYRDSVVDVSFTAAGDYDFEWVSYNAGGDYGAEISVTFEARIGSTGPVNSDNFDPLGAPLQLPVPINLVNNTINLTVYVPDEDPVVEIRPFLVAIETGQPLIGGVISGQEGTGFFAGAGLNKYGNGGAKTLTLRPIDVTGKPKLKLTFAIAGTDLDFETSDYLLVSIDKNNTGSFEQLVNFTAPTANDKYVTDGTTRVGPVFKDVTYDLPADSTSLVIRIEALTTWWNEIIAFDNIRITSGDLVQVLPAQLTATTANGKITIAWAPDGGKLQRAGAVTGPWSDVAGETPVTVDLTGSEGYFRVIK